MRRVSRRSPKGNFDEGKPFHKYFAYIYLLLSYLTRQYKDWIDSPWSGFFEGRDTACGNIQTGVTIETLTHIGNVFSAGPQNSPDFVLHKGIERVLQARRKMVEEGVADWALGEAFGFGTLLKEGTHVRLSGQDVERGTFSHRHHVLHNQKVDLSLYRPLSHLYRDQATYSVANSSLSESGRFGMSTWK